MLGGQVKENTLATIGSSAMEILRRYCFDKSFIGMNGNINLLFVGRVINARPPYTMTVQQSHHMQVD